MNRFVQLHFLTSYPATLLNRDDVGSAKRIPFGGVPRLRISSQCLKRHWRTYQGQHSLAELAVPGSIRSRQTFEQFIVRPLLKEGGMTPEIVRAVTEALMGKVLGKREEKKSDGEDATTAGKSAAGSRAKTKAATKADSTADGASGETKPAEKASAVHTDQVTVLGRPEVEFLLAEARAICKAVSDPKLAGEAVNKHFTKERLENLKSLKHASGLDAALFGRMVTSDILARGDAAVHVAHALTVHEEATEPDYFAAVDDLLGGADDPQLGSGHIGTTELTSGLFYGYVVVDIPLLVSNLEGCLQKDWAQADRGLASRVVEQLVHLIATVTPGAKLGSTAPYAVAHLVLAEVGNAQPRTLANAFFDRVQEKPSLLGNTYNALGRYLQDVDGMYGVPGGRALAAIGPTEVLRSAVGIEKTISIDALARWCAEQVQAS